eukprot:2832740-Rhodomonas_salina.2
MKSKKSPFLVQTVRRPRLIVFNAGVCPMLPEIPLARRWAKRRLFAEIACKWTWQRGNSC